MKTIINKIELKVVKLIEKCNQLSLDKYNLQKKNDTLNFKLQEKEKEFVTLQDKVKLIKISKSVDKTNEGLAETRKKINEYVREIDKCIALLNK